MEKLQPLIKHKFWILLGAVLMLTIAGWWISTSAKAAYIKQRWETLSGLNVPSGSGTPNEIYIKGIDGVITVLDKRQEELDNRLYESQKSLHTWPPYVAKHMEGKLFGDPIPQNVRSVYAGYHLREIEQMLANVPQYRWDPRTGAETGIVEVYADPSKIPMGPVDKWKDNPPLSQIVWETQEDVWLTRSILEAIKKVNQDAGATKISDAAVRIIDKLELRGGSRASGAGGAMPGGGYEGGGGVYGAEMAASEGGGYGASGEGGSAGYMDGGEYGGGGNTVSFNATITIDLNSVFGSDAMMAAATGGSADVMAAPMMGAAGGPGKRRYVDDDPTLPYKTRGFYLEVLMDHQKLPDLQAALVSMPWPTELLMIHQASDKTDEIIPVETQRLQKNRPMRPTQGGQFGNQPFANRRGAMNNRFGNQRFGASGRNRFGGGAFNRFGGAAGGFGGMEPMGSEYETTEMYGMEEGMGPGYGGGRSSQGEATSSYEKAIEDFYLVRVGIAGLMTIYRSPQERAAEEAQAAGGVQPAPETQTPTGEPAQPGTQPPAGEAVQPGTQPMPGIEPAQPGAEPMPGVPMEPGTEPKPGEAPLPEANTVPPGAAPENPAPMPKSEAAPASSTPPSGEPAPAAENPPNPNPSPPNEPAPPAN